MVNRVKTFVVSFSILETWLVERCTHQYAAGIKGTGGGGSALDNGDDDSDGDGVVVGDLCLYIELYKTLLRNTLLRTISLP